MNNIEETKSACLKHSVIKPVAIENNVIPSTTPSTLRELSMQFVAQNASSIDSLDGFPSEIAKEIFHRCVDKFKDFSNGPEQCNILELFIKSYPDEFLISCTFSRLETLSELDNHMPIILRGLQRLDISGCKIGDAHDILPLLRTCERLVALSIADNNLTYKGLRSLCGTLPSQTMQLEYLDVSNNTSISNVGITKYVTRLTSIQRILVSVSPNDIKEWNINLLKEGFGSQKCAIVQEVFENEGWAEQIITNWESPNFFASQTSRRCNINKKKGIKRKMAQNFYSKNTVRRSSETSYLPDVSNIEFTPILYHRFSREQTPEKHKHITLSNSKDEEDDFISISEMYR